MKVGWSARDHRVLVNKQHCVLEYQRFKFKTAAVANLPDRTGRNALRPTAQDIELHFLIFDSRVEFGRPNNKILLYIWNRIQINKLWSCYNNLESLLLVIFISKIVKSIFNISNTRIYINFLTLLIELTTNNLLIKKENIYVVHK